MEGDVHEEATTGWGWIGFAVGAVLLQLLYLVVPVDLVPDLIPVVGWIDDVVVLMAGICATAVGSYLVRQRGARALEAPGQGALEDAYEPLSPEEIRAL